MKCNINICFFQSFSPVAVPVGPGTMQQTVSYPGNNNAPQQMYSIQTGYVQNPTVARDTTFHGVLPDGGLYCNTNTQGPAVPGARFVLPPGGAIPTGQEVPHRSRPPPTVPTNPAAPNGQFIAYSPSAGTCLPLVIAGSIQGATPPSVVICGTTFYQQPGSDHQLFHPSHILNAAAVAALTSPVLPGGKFFYSCFFLQ